MTLGERVTTFLLHLLDSMCPISRCLKCHNFSTLAHTPVNNCQGEPLCRGVNGRYGVLSVPDRLVVA